jgi:phosphatidylglycerophosphate synthase
LSALSENRRPLKSRQTGWARRCAAGLARLGVAPDAISAGSAVFALVGAAAFLLTARVEGATRIAVFVAAAAAIQSRLLCNLLDGMVAVEHGRGSAIGPIWNELPDRIADVALLVGAGYGAALSGVSWAAAAGWSAAVLAVLTAYVRELGRGLGQPADFSGPGAKPHRMAALTVAALASAVLEPHLLAPGQVMAWSLVFIAALASVTLVRRTLHLALRLRAAATPTDS